MRGECSTTYRSPSEQSEALVQQRRVDAVGTPPLATPAPELLDQHVQQYLASTPQATATATESVSPSVCLLSFMANSPRPLQATG
jgi:hypothetical protein